jgi:predicted DNA-binding protein
MSKQVGLRLECSIVEDYTIIAGRQGKTPSQWIREAILFKIAADREGVQRLGDYWVVPDAHLALVRRFPELD